MRILLFSAADKSDAAGVQGVVTALAASMRRRGHEVVTAWPDGTEGPEEWRLDLETDVGPDDRPSLRGLTRAARDGARLASRLAAFRPDVVNFHYPRGQLIYFFALRRALRYGLVPTFHNTDLAEAQPAVLSRLPGWLRRADAVTAVSDDLAAAIERHAPGIAPVVIPNGVETGFWRPAGQEARDPCLVAAAGRMIGMKGFDLLLAAFARGAPPNARMEIAGEGPEREALVAQARALGLEGRVTFLGRLDRDGLRALFRRAGLFVLPSRREGMPLVLIEAMACGLPAVAAGVNGVPYVMTPGCGAVVPPEDVAALAEALGERIGEPGRLAREGAAALERASELDIERCMDAYERVLSGAARRTPAGATG